MVSWSKPINASQSVLDMLDAHRDMPTVQDTRDRLTNRCSDQAGECCFTVAQDSDGAARPPPLVFKRLSYGAEWRNCTLGSKGKAPRRSTSNLDFANRNVDMSCLIARSGSNMAAIDQNNHIGGLAGFCFRFRRHNVPGLQFGCHLMRAIAHCRVIGRLARKQHGKQSCRLAI